ncbi:ABC transporter substrate-binding protein [Chondrinema litorale]|uniref:ABC transporter substrate-binding protein n=1 Tax=Chondrinema litorale TaxID=2994555 RepID=UPI002542B161|nr:ABC transporter substrate-binding protein [Chondrinema litorale]UZR99779.1 ABC transporter substrate-binding protein [Chondrinema litorale]
MKIYHSTNTFLPVVLLFFAASIFSSCNQNKSASEITQTQELTSNNSVPKSIETSFSQKFKVDYLADDEVKISIEKPWEGSKDLYEYKLKSNAGRGEINYPVKSVACLSSTHVEMLKELGLLDKIVAINSYDDIFDQEIKDVFKARGVKEVGKSKNVNIELLLDIKPDLILESTTGSGYDAYEALTKYHLPVVTFAAHKENFPLGRLEWIKLLSVFFQKEQEANAYFKTKEALYNHLLNKKQTPEKQPVIFVGYNWKETWYLPGSKSYMAEFIKDAGGKYIMADNKETGNVAIAHEQVIELLQQCDIWLHPGIKITSEADLKELKIPNNYFKNGLQVYNNNKKLNDLGKNDFWQSGFVHPELVLQDLSLIFQKDSLSNKKLIYYKKIL